MYNLPPWLLPARDALEGLLARRQFPHALLIHGPAGNGRRLLALWVAGRLLGLERFDLSAGLGAGRLLDSDRVSQHPDLSLVEPLLDKQGIPKRSISIDQIRELIMTLNLTSHQRGAKVALVTPAQAMTPAAANGLLKTLEEPPGSSLIVLVSDALSRLTPTVVSRCHRVRVATPAPAAAVAWLGHQRADSDWGPVLELAGGAPLAALELQQTGFAQQAAELEQDVLALLDRKRTPTEVARRWSRLDQDLYLRWLYQRITDEIRAASGKINEKDESESRNRRLQIAGKMLNIERSFAYLLEINDLRRLKGAGLNEDLQLTELLSRWYGGVGL